MKPRARRQRAMLRDRRRGPADDGPPLFGPLTGYGLWLVHHYNDLRYAALAYDVHRDPPVLPVVPGALEAVRDWNAGSSASGHGPEDYPEG